MERKTPTKAEVDHLCLTLSKRVYAETQMVEDWEYEWFGISNGHHARQKMAALCEDELLRRLAPILSEEDAIERFHYTNPESTINMRKR